MELFLLACLGVGIWWWLKSRQSASDLQFAQGIVEKRALQLLGEFPGMSDQDIATLLRDELVNGRITHHAYFAWATVDTVARLRRTVLLAVARDERAAREAIPVQAAPPAEATSFTNENGVKIVRLKTCSGCGTQVRGDAVRCPKCGAFFSSKKTA